MQSSCILAILLVRSEENARVFLPKELPLTVYLLCKPNRLVCGKILAYLAPIAMPHSNHLHHLFFYILMLSSGLEKVICTMATCLNELSFILSG